MKYRYWYKTHGRVCQGTCVILGCTSTHIQLKPDNAQAFQIETRNVILETIEMSDLIKVGDVVKYNEGRADGLLPDDMVGEAREVQQTAQGTKKVRVVTPTGGSALIEEFRLVKVQKLFG